MTRVKEGRTAIIQLLINFIPLALAAIAPVGFVLVIFLITSKDGLRKTLAYMMAQALAFAIWGLVFLNLSLRLVGPSSPEIDGTLLSIRVILGILLLVMAVRILITDQDPDALPLKWKSLIERISAITLFFINLFLSLFQLRFVLRIMIGVDMINSAQFPQSEALMSLLILLFVLLWPQLVPLAVYLALKNQRDKALKTMDNWMARNSRFINAGLLGGLGIILVWGT